MTVPRFRQRRGRSGCRSASKHLALVPASRRSFLDALEGHLICKRCSTLTVPPPPPKASEHGHNGVLDALVELGADLHVRNGLGWTALHYAAFNGRLSAVKRLLTAGLPPDARTHASWTPLHHAAVRGNHRTIRALVAAGADKSVLSQQGVTVAEMLRALTKLRTEEEDLQACARTPPPPRCCARPRPPPLLSACPGLCFVGRPGSCRRLQPNRIKLRPSSSVELEEARADPEHAPPPQAACLAALEPLPEGTRTVEELIAAGVKL